METDVKTVSQRESVTCTQSPSKMKQSQKDRIVKRLLERGEVTRNEALRNFISRLSAIIQDLEEEGWEFKTENRKGDYVYTAIKKPYQTITYILADGREILTTEKI